jgi:hypothetical protein
MLRKMTYRRRLILLSIIVVFIIPFTFQVAISPTIKLKKDLNKLRENLMQIEKAPLTILRYEKRLREVNAKIGENYDQNVDFQKNLLNEISKSCDKYGLILREFPQVFVWKNQNYDFITGYARIEGSFIPLLKLLNKIETERFYGKLVSVNFMTENDFKAKRLRLTMSIYIQMIKQSTNEVIPDKN